MKKTMKQLLMLKLLMIGAMSTLGADEVFYKRLIDFQTKLLAKNPNVTLKDIKVVGDTQVPQAKDWKAYRLQMKVNYRNRDIDINEMVFSNGKLIAPDLLSFDGYRSIKDDLTPEFELSNYDQAHLMAGSLEAKHKVAVFSDPLCPYCQKTIVEMIQFVNDNPDAVGLYYFGFPLVSIHPAAGTLTKASLVAKKRGIPAQDIKSKLYGAQLNSKITPKKALSEFNELMGFEGKKAIVAADFTDDINKIYEADLRLGRKLMVQGTPTIFVNGKKDTSHDRKGYKKLTR